MIKNKKPIDLDILLQVIMICGYGVAIWCALSLLSHFAEPRYFDFDSKGASIPVKIAAHDNPKYVVVTLLTGTTVGAIANVIWKKRNA